ncbi:MAG: cytochrome C oxidase subunit IV family protein [Pseudomonadales bacterium]|nr:cytochrome C oxidase subunit IV family protein [Pseudomonadales bacterium]
MENVQSGEEGSQHPLSLYFIIWGLLFVLSAFSYSVDYMQIQGELRWGLIIMFMILKAGFIIWFFMHMKWERLVLITAILLPPLVLGVFILLMNIEGNSTYDLRLKYYDVEKTVPYIHPNSSH